MNPIINSNTPLEIHSGKRKSEVSGNSTTLSSTPQKKIKTTSNASEASFNNLPQGVFHEIFSKFSTIDQLKFQKVCKVWKIYIELLIQKVCKSWNPNLSPAKNWKNGCLNINLSLCPKEDPREAYLKTLNQLDTFFKNSPVEHIQDKKWILDSSFTLPVEPTKSGFKIIDFANKATYLYDLKGNSQNSISNCGNPQKKLLPGAILQSSIHNTSFFTLDESPLACLGDATFSNDDGKKVVEVGLISLKNKILYIRDSKTAEIKSKITITETHWDLLDTKYVHQFALTPEHILITYDPDGQGSLHINRKSILLNRTGTKVWNLKENNLYTLTQNYLVSAYIDSGQTNLFFEVHDLKSTKKTSQFIIPGPTTANLKDDLTFFVSKPKLNDVWIAYKSNLYILELRTNKQTLTDIRLNQTTTLPRQETPIQKIIQKGKTVLFWKLASNGFLNIEAYNLLENTKRVLLGRKFEKVHQDISYRFTTWETRFSQTSQLLYYKKHFLELDKESSPDAKITFKLLQSISYGNTAKKD